MTASASFRRLTANFFGHSAGEVVYAVSQFCLLAIVGRLDSPEALGRYAVAVSIATPLFILANLHLRPAFIADPDGPAAFPAYLGLRAIACAAAAAATLAAGLLKEADPAGWAVFGAVAWIRCVENLADILYALPHRAERLPLSAFSRGLKGALGVGAVLLTIRAGGSSTSGLFAFALASSAVLVLVDLPLARRFGPVRPTFRPEALLSLAKRTWPIGVAAALLLIATNTPLYALEWSAPARDVGYYSALLPLFQAQQIVALALGAALLPRTAGLFRENPPRARALAFKGAGLAALLTAPAVAVCAAAGPRLMALAYGPSYAPLGGPLLLAAQAGVAASAAVVLSLCLTSLGRFRVDLRVNATLLLGAVLCAALLVPAFGIEGALWSLLLMSVLRALLCAFALAAAGTSHAPSPSLRDELAWRVRRALRDRWPRLFRALKEIDLAARLYAWKLHQLLRGDSGGRLPRDLRPALQRFRSREDLRVESDEDILREARALGLSWAQGLHTIYFPPQPGLAKLLGELVEAYPPDAGFKILRNLAPPETVNYLRVSDTLHEREMLGGVSDLARNAAWLRALDLGPRFYDVAQLRLGSADATVFVVEHVEGTAPGPDDHAAFIRRLAELQRDGLLRLVPPTGLRAREFQGPDCNGNLLRTPDGRPRYVDPQLFLFDDAALARSLLSEAAARTHFGDRALAHGSGRPFLYQSLPGAAALGKRDTARRWDVIATLLKDAGADPRGRVVFDVCCNAGLMMAMALRDGATWAVGWDLPDVIPATERVLAALGVGRVTLAGARLDESSSLEAAVPAWLRPRARDGVLLFLAAWHHVGLPAGLRELGWRWLVFEGHESDTEKDVEDAVGRLAAFCGARVVGSALIRDGLSRSRALRLLERREPASGPAPDGSRAS